MKLLSSTFPAAPARLMPCGALLVAALALCAPAHAGNLTLGTDPLGGGGGTQPTQGGGDAFAMPYLPTMDLSLVIGGGGGLFVGDVFAPWGGVVTLSAADASDTLWGKCVFRYRYRTANEGAVASIATINRIFREGPPWQVLAADALPPLLPTQSALSSGLMALPEGGSTLYVEADSALLNPESDEVDNLRRVTVIVRGDCG